MQDYGIINGGKLSVSKTPQAGYKPIDYAPFPEFDQASQCVVQGDVEDKGSSIYIGFLVQDIETDSEPAEPDGPPGEFIEQPPRNEKGEAEKVELLEAQNKALSDRAEFIEEVIAEMAMMIYV